mmetsp:Transcript_29431/g.67677  ORF Transcript_29431/g.67677 Transcript_29431/m.67677 type:complete len:204 (+) Transcript_29431:3253-3864(+)
MNEPGESVSRISITCHSCVMRASVAVRRYDCTLVNRWRPGTATPFLVCEVLRERDVLAKLEARLRWARLDRQSFFFCASQTWKSSPLLRCARGIVSSSSETITVEDTLPGVCFTNARAFRWACGPPMASSMSTTSSPAEDVSITGRVDAKAFLRVTCFLLSLLTLTFLSSQLGCFTLGTGLGTSCKAAGIVMIFWMVLLKRSR